MSHEEIRKALVEPSKASRKALAKLSLEMETVEPERYKEILGKRDWDGEALSAYRAYRRTFVLSRVAMILACLVVVGSYFAGDFGLQLLTGRLERYTLALGVSIGMGLFAGGTLLLNAKKDRLIAYGILTGL